MNVSLLAGKVYREPLFNDKNGTFKGQYLLLASDSCGSKMIPVNAYGKVAEFVQENIHEGMMITVRGHLHNFEDKTTGKYSLGFVAERHDIERVESDGDDTEKMNESNIESFRYEDFNFSVNN